MHDHLADPDIHMTSLNELATDHLATDIHIIHQFMNACKL